MTRIAMTELYELYLWTEWHESPIQSNKSGLNFNHFDATVIYRKRIKDELPKIWTFSSPLPWPLTLNELDIWHNASIFHKTLFMRKYLIYPWNQQKKNTFRGLITLQVSKLRQRPFAFNNSKSIFGIEFWYIFTSQVS